jgi:starch synthase
VTRGRDIRILGAGRDPIAQFRDGAGRNAGLFTELDRRYQVVGAIRPSLGNLEHYALKLRYFRPDRVAWRGRASLNSWNFRRLSSIAGTQLRAWEGRYDLIMLWQTLFAPGRDVDGGRYVVYTDNTYALTERFLPAWAPLGRREGRRWADLERRTCHAALRVFAVSDLLRQSLIDDYGCDPACVVKVGAGTNSFVKSLSRAQHDSQAALFVGFNFELKGGYVLLRAWDRVREQLPRAELWIAGPSTRVPQQPGVRSFGKLDREAVAALYDRAAVFVLPSLYDSYPHALREAMGHGLPCIGTNRGGVPEIIDHERTGLIVEPEDPDQLADALVSLLADPARSEAMGREGHAKILSSYKWSYVVDRMAPHIERVAAPGA